MPSLCCVLVSGSDGARETASSSTDFTTSSLRSAMSLNTPDEEYAAGMVSDFSHSPLANSKKSVHALTVVSMYDTSTTFSGASPPRSAEGACSPGAQAAVNAAASTVTTALELREKRNMRTPGMSGSKPRSMIQSPLRVATDHAQAEDRRDLAALLRLEPDRHALSALHERGRDGVLDIDEA